MNDLEYFYKKVFQIKFDEELYDLLSKCLVGIVKGERDHAVKIRTYLKKAISKDELGGPYRLIYEICIGNSLFSSSDIEKLKIDDDLFGTILNNGIDMYVKKFSKEFETWITSNGLEYNLDSPKGIEDFTNFLYGQTIKLYREICGNTPEQAEEYTHTLSKELKSRAVSVMIGYIAEINTKGFQMGKTLLSGSDDAINMTDKLTNYINQKYNWLTIKSEKYIIDDISSAKDIRVFKEKQLSLTGGESRYFKRLYDMHMGKLNLEAEVGDIITMIADEGTGKTKWLVEQTFYALGEGKNVMIVCTETPKDILLNMLFARIVLAKLGKSISEKEIMQMPDHINLLRSAGKEDKARYYEELLLEIYEATDEWFDDPNHGILSLRQSATYFELYTLIKDYKESRNGDIVGIDSISYLDKHDGMAERRNYVDLLMETMKECATTLGMTFLMTTHTGSDASKTFARGKDNVGKRVSSDSSSVTKLSSIILVMWTTEELSKKNLFIIKGNKLRYRPDSVSIVIMERNAPANHYEYKEEQQMSLDGVDDMSIDEKFI